MIVVQSVLVPHGDPNNNQQLCTMTITNDGEGTDSRRNYIVRLYSRGKKPRIIRTCKIEGYPAKQQPAWRLIAKAFQELEKIN